MLGAKIAMRSRQSKCEGVNDGQAAFMQKVISEGGIKDECHKQDDKISQLKKRSANCPYKGQRNCKSGKLTPTQFHSRLIEDLEISRDRHRSKIILENAL